LRLKYTFPCGRAISLQIVEVFNTIIQTGEIQKSEEDVFLSSYLKRRGRQKKS
jgi:hypothetical protein